MADQSASAYDMSLASFAARAGWPDQQIADLMIAHRRAHGIDLKTSGRLGAIRLDYYQRTIAAARVGAVKAAAVTVKAVERERAMRAIDEACAHPPESVGASERDSLLQSVSAVVGIKILGVVKYGVGDDALYILKLEGEDVTLGTAKDVDSQSTFRHKIYAKTNRMPTPIKPDVWTRLLNMLGMVAEPAENPESAPLVRFAAMLSDYLDTELMETADNWQRAMQRGAPFVLDGRVHVNGSRLMTWLGASGMPKVSQGWVWDCFRSAGFDAKVVSTKVEGRSCSKRYWTVPLDDALGIGVVLQAGKFRGGAA